MKIFVFSLLVLGITSFGITNNVAWALPVTLSNVPDFSQHSNAGWSNYCAPTSGTNVAYYFSQNGFPNLRQTNPIGPDAVPPGPADNGATTITGGGLAAPPPPAGSMAGITNMMTGLMTGTTPNKLQSGLDNYLEANDNDPNTTWNTQLVEASTVGGAAFWLQLQTAINNGAGVVLLIDWQSNPPQADADSNYDQPDDTGTGPNQSLSHAVTMVGFDVMGVDDVYINDPANNLMIGQNWSPGSGEQYPITIGANSLSLTINSAPANIYAAVITNPVTVSHGPMVVGGEFIGIETTSVLAAGAQYTAAWMIPVIVSGIGFAIVITRKF